MVLYDVVFQFLDEEARIHKSALLTPDKGEKSNSTSPSFVAFINKTYYRDLLFIRIYCERSPLVKGIKHYKHVLCFFLIGRQKILHDRASTKNVVAIMNERILIKILASLFNIRSL